MSEISIQMGEDGFVGVINGEPVSYDCDVFDDDTDRFHYRVRRFRIPLGSGYDMSVTFGTGSYSTNHFVGFAWENEPGRDEWHDVVTAAEIAVLGPGHAGVVELFRDEWGDSVLGYCDAGDILNWVLEARRRIREFHSDFPLGG